MKSKPCKTCSSEWHSSFTCPYRQKKGLLTRKRMNKIGRVTRATQDYVAAWKKTQQPDANGMHTCYISGLKVPYLMAEHPYSKARHPELRTSQTLEPVSAEINKLKGSLDIHDFLEKYPQFKATVKKEYLGEPDGRDQE